MGLLVGGVALLGIVLWRSADVVVPAPSVAGSAASTADSSLPPLPSGGAAETTASSTAAPAVARAEATPTVAAMTAVGQALLLQAATDRTFNLVVAEVLAVGAIERADVADGPLEHQTIRLHVLDDCGDGVGAVRRYARLEVPLCPATSERLYGCSTPFGDLAIGQVRTFVLARGRPDFGALSVLCEPRTRWLVLAGPVVERPFDPVLAALPSQLVPYLGRPLCNVFRARVVQARAGAAPSVGKRQLGNELALLEVQVTEVAQQGGRLPVRGKLRLVQVPFAPAPDPAALPVGDEFWFATDETAIWHVLRAFAPVR